MTPREGGIGRARLPRRAALRVPPMKPIAAEPQPKERGFRECRGWEKENIESLLSSAPSEMRGFPLEIFASREEIQCLYFGRRPALRAPLSFLDTTVAAGTNAQRAAARIGQLPI